MSPTPIGDAARGFCAHPLWAQALWIATAFRWHPSSEAPPVMGLVFADAGKGNHNSADWFQLSPERGAAIMVHELYHREYWTPGVVEEDEAWELTALVWAHLGSPKSGQLWADVSYNSQLYGFPLP